MISNAKEGGKLARQRSILVMTCEEILSKVLPVIFNHYKMIVALGGVYRMRNFLGNKSFDKGKNNHRKMKHKTKRK